MLENFPSSSDKSSGDVQENPPDAHPPRWQQGCYHKYRISICRVADCPYLHDLNPEEVQRFLAWKQGEQQHLVFNSRSATATNSTNSNSTSFSGGGGAPQSGSIVEIVSRFAAIPSLGPERQQLTRKLKERFLHVSDEEILRLLPRDDAGRVTSIGGLLHESGTCRPCRTRLASQVCSKGMRCGFCHYPHDPAPASLVEMDLGDKKPGGTRPCKAQRDKYRKHVKRIEDQIRADPWSFDPTTVDLPPNIFDGRPEVKSKFLMRLSALRDSVKADFWEAAAGQGANDTTKSRSQAGHSSSDNQAGHSAPSGPSLSSNELLPVRSKDRHIVHL